MFERRKQRSAFKTEVVAPRVGLGPTTLRLTATVFICRILFQRSILPDKLAV